VCALEKFGLVHISDVHRHYLKEIMVGDWLSERILGKLDISTENIQTTIPMSECKDIDFHFGKMIPRREHILIDWIQRYLAKNENSCFLFLNTCAEKHDGNQYANVIFYHDREDNVDKIVHIVFDDTSEHQILRTLKDAETSIALVGVAISGIRFDKSCLYSDVREEFLLGLLDFANYLVLGICDGEAWCFWPMLKPKPNGDYRSMSER